MLEVGVGDLLATTLSGVKGPWSSFMIVTGECMHAWGTVDANYVRTMLSKF